MVLIMTLTLAFYTPHLFTHFWSGYPILFQTLHLKAYIFQLCVDLLNSQVRICIGVSCNLIAISKVLSYFVNFFCDRRLLKCCISDATIHSQCCPSIIFVLASWIVHFKFWSNSQGVSPSSIMIYLNPMIDYASDFSLLNSLFSVTWISVIPAFGLLLECLIYQVSVRSCRALTNVTFFILSSVTPCTSHMALITNQN